MATSYTGYTWAQNTLYNYQVQSQDEAGVGTYSPSLTVLTPNIPGQMGPPSIAQADILAATINITWSALTTVAQTNNCSISGYLLQVSASGSATWTSLTSTTYTSTFYTQTSATFTPGTTYIYRLTAYNYFGAGPSSTNITIATDTIPTAAPTPTCGAITSNTISLSWTSLTSTQIGNAAVYYYQLQWYDTVAGNVWITVNTDTTTLVTSTILTNSHSNQVSPYTTTNAFTVSSVQQFRVSAFNGVGQGPYSTTISCTTNTFPTGTVTLVQGAVHPLNVTLSWPSLTTGTGGVSVTFYAIEYSTTSSTTGFVQVNAYTEGLYLTYTHVSSTVFASGSSIYYRARAANSVGYSPNYSTVLTVTACSIPTS